MKNHRGWGQIDPPSPPYPAAFKHLFGYKENKKVRPLCIVLPEMSGCRREFDKIFLIKDDKLLENHNKIWNKVSIGIKKGFDSKPVYHEKHLKTKIL